MWHGGKYGLPLPSVKRDGDGDGDSDEDNRLIMSDQFLSMLTDLEKLVHGAKVDVEERAVDAEAQTVLTQALLMPIHCTVGYVTQSPVMQAQAHEVDLIASVSIGCGANAKKISGKGSGSPLPVPSAKAFQNRKRKEKKKEAKVQLAQVICEYCARGLCTGCKTTEASALYEMPQVVEAAQSFFSGLPCIECGAYLFVVPQESTCDSCGRPVACKVGCKQCQKLYCFECGVLIHYERRGAAAASYPE
jgi:hypothetical protein